MRMRRSQQWSRRPRHRRSKHPCEYLDVVFDAYQRFMSGEGSGEVKSVSSEIGIERRCRGCMQGMQVGVFAQLSWWVRDCVYSQYT